MHFKVVEMNDSDSVENKYISAQIESILFGLYNFLKKEAKTNFIIYPYTFSGNILSPPVLSFALGIGAFYYAVI